MELDLTYDKDNYLTILENINSKLLTTKKSILAGFCSTIYVVQDNEDNEEHI